MNINQTIKNKKKNIPTNNVKLQQIGEILNLYHNKKTKSSNIISYALWSLYDNSLLFNFIIFYIINALFNMYSYFHFTKKVYFLRSFTPFHTCPLIPFNNQYFILNIKRKNKHTASWLHNYTQLPLFSDLKQFYANNTLPVLSDDQMSNSHNLFQWKGISNFGSSPYFYMQYYITNLLMTWKIVTMVSLISYIITFVIFFIILSINYYKLHAFIKILMPFCTISFLIVKVFLSALVILFKNNKESQTNTISDNRNITLLALCVWNSIQMLFVSLNASILDLKTYNLKIKQNMFEKGNRSIEIQEFIRENILLNTLFTIFLLETLSFRKKNLIMLDIYKHRPGFFNLLSRIFSYNLGQGSTFKNISILSHLMIYLMIVLVMSIYIIIINDFKTYKRSPSLGGKILFYIWIKMKLIVGLCLYKVFDDINPYINSYNYHFTDKIKVKSRFKALNINKSTKLILNKK